jgi:hypothetical protein
MPNYYVENAERWKALAHIDYFTHFVKAWIPFNAWYRNYYQGLESDADIMQEIKTRNNKFKNRLVNLLQGAPEDNERQKFRAHLSDLHYQLEQTPIYNGDERISFLSIVVERNIKRSETIVYRGFTYKAEMDTTNRKKITVTVLDSKSVTRLSITQNNGYDFGQVENDPSYQRLTAEPKAKLKACYQEINPRKPVSLLTSDINNCIKIGSYHFINDADLIAKGVITAIYNLRNALFHGQIVPDRETQKVYEPAYHILSTLVEGLG